MNGKIRNEKTEHRPRGYARIWELALERYELHVHSRFEITLMLSGSIQQMCDGVTTTLTPGHVTFLSPNCIHQYYSSGEKAKIINLTFPADYVSNDVWKYVDMSRMPLVIKLDGDSLVSIKDTLNSIHSLSREYMQPLEKSVYLKNMIEWLILKLFSYANSSVMKEDSFSPAIIYIHSNFTRDITEKEVAAFMHYSPSYFSMLFKRKFGIPFKTYLLNLRLDYAADLLETTEYSISQICERSGFVTPVYFSRAFKRKFGITPTEHRKNKININQGIC